MKDPLPSQGPCSMELVGSLFLWVLELKLEQAMQAERGRRGIALRFL